MTYRILLILLAFALFSCSKDDFLNKKIDYSLPETEIIGIENIDKSVILPEAAEYFGNIALMANWYSENQSFRQRNKPLSPSDAVNTIALKLEEFSLIDSTGCTISLFDLNKNDWNEFLSTWKVVEAYDLSIKLKKDSTRESSLLLVKRNKAFTKAFCNEKSAQLSCVDPFWKVKSEIDKIEQKLITEEPEIPTLKSSVYSDDNFWAAVVANRKLSFSVIQASPIVLSPQTFVDRLRQNIKKGRILISLPGGWTTHLLIVFYPNTLWYDVGHTAIITKDGDELGEVIEDSCNMTVGTSPAFETNAELLGHSWCYKHGLSFIGQVFDVQWKKVQNEEGKWQWKKIMTEVDNEKISDLAIEQIGKPYCNVFDIFISKWAAPESFICSSLPWWCVKEETGIDISDWWNPSIYPVNILFSENVKIIDDTLE